jgi:hypothetical protein
VHHGSVVARSEGTGKGTTFEVRLPLALDQQPCLEEPSALRPLPDCRVLVVDDNKDAADMLGMLLNSLNATVRTVHSGPDALALIDEFEPEVVLLDIGMPFMDGYEVARRTPASIITSSSRRISRHWESSCPKFTSPGTSPDQRNSRGRTGFHQGSSVGRH